MESAAVLQEIQRVAVLRESAEKRVRAVHHTRILDEQAARKARLLEDMKKAGLDPKSKCGKAMLRGYE